MVQMDQNKQILKPVGLAEDWLWFMRDFLYLFRISTGNGGKAELSKKIKASPQAGSLESSQQRPGSCTEY